MNAAGGRASSHSVKSSSNWSTTTSSAGASSTSSSGRRPGHQRARGEPGDLARLDGGHEAGAQHRRLAAARRADHGHEPARREPRR